MIFKQRPNLKMLCLFVLIGVSACAGIETGTAVRDTIPSLRARADAYWQHRIKGDLARAYDFEFPDFRKKINLTNYIMVFAGATSPTKVVVQSVDVEDDWARVIIKITRPSRMRVHGPKGGSTTSVISEFWQRDNGQWYHHPFTPKSQIKGPSHGKH